MARGNPRREREVSQAIAEILEDDISDPRLTLVTITDVQVTPDFEHAKVYYSTLDPDLVARDPARTGGDRVAEPHDVAAGFEAARARIQSLLSRRVRMRRTPQLTFEPDPVVAQAARVEDLIRRVRDDEGRTE